MPGVWIKTTEGWQATTRFAAKTSSGWFTGKNLYRKSSEVLWQTILSPDTTGPAKPVLLSTTFDVPTRGVKISVKMPGDVDVRDAVLVYSNVAHPSFGQNMTDWAIQPAAANGTNTWVFVAPAYTTKYYVSVWAIDQSGNLGTRMTTEFSIAKPVTAPPPVKPVVRSGTWNALVSGTWGLNSHIWSPGMGSNVGQAGPYNYRGAWIYGGRIEGALAKAKKIRRATIKITRMNTNHGPPYNGWVWLTMHKLGSRGAGGTGDKPLSPVFNPPVRVGSLAKGQQGVYDIPTQWYDDLLAGNGWKGFGLWYPEGITAANDVNHIQCYGAGTTSGQVFIEFEE